MICLLLLGPKTRASGWTDFRGSGHGEAKRTEKAEWRRMRHAFRVQSARSASVLAIIALRAATRRLRQSLRLLAGGAARPNASVATGCSFLSAYRPARYFGVAMMAS